MSEVRGTPCLFRSSDRFLPSWSDDSKGLCADRSAGRAESPRCYSRSGLYARIAAGLFPRPIALGARAATWPEHEIDVVIAALIRTVGDDDLRTLVDGLHTQRSTFGLGGDSDVLGGATAASSPPSKTKALRRAS